MLIRIAASALLFPLLALAQAPAASSSQIVTSASGEARLAPDRASVLVGVQTRAATAAAAARENSARQQAVISAIVAAGIPREQISSENYNVYGETRAEPGQNPVVVGYVVSNVVRVELRRTDLVGPVIDAALSKGANQMHGLEFYSSNSDAGRRQALAEAIARARGDAETMARAAGGKLGTLLELSTTDAGPRPLYRNVATMDKATSLRTPIEPGELTVRVTVSARWQFLPNQ